MDLTDYHALKYRSLAVRRRWCQFREVLFVGRIVGVVRHIVQNVAPRNYSDNFSVRCNRYASEVIVHQALAYFLNIFILVEIDGWGRHKVADKPISGLSARIEQI